ncbi:cytochrome c biogenesis protein ResB [Saliterribacillus persicus]|nr:cytochrome c biogenesis protein ResB [Saliterribacillus persicus]
MKTITCNACGHINKEGTMICGSCGKPLDSISGEDKNTLLNMRYDGTAVRSKTRNRSIIDKIWNFFSSIKIGVTLIVLALISSAVGTILPQEMYIPQNVDAFTHYRDEYGLFGQIYYQLGFHNLYSSWWYMILIALIGISIFIVSIDRGVPLYKALTNQNPKRHTGFLKRQKLYSESETYDEDEKEQLLFNLKKHRYNIFEKDGHLLAEKGRFARWGPYVNHLGLIIFLLGTLFRFVPFMYVDDFVWVREGETVVIPSTSQEYYVENKKFIIENYGEDEAEVFAEAIQNQEGPIAKHFETQAVIYKDQSTNIVGEEPDLNQIKEGSIIVNKPLKFDGFSLYQSSYQTNEFKSMSFKLHETSDENEDAIAEFKIDLDNPENNFTFDNGYRIELDQFYPDYYLDEGQPKSQSNYPRNPGFVFFVYPPNEEEPEVSFAAIGKNIDPTNDNDYKIGLTDFEVRNASGLSLKKDYTLPILGLGAFIFMIGVIQGMYWQHRRIWFHPTSKGIIVAGHTNKNWFGFKNEVDKIFTGTSLQAIKDLEEDSKEDRSQS